jgi:hypothetical protein
MSPILMRRDLGHDRDLGDWLQTCPTVTWFQCFENGVTRNFCRVHLSICSVAKSSVSMASSLPGPGCDQIIFFFFPTMFLRLIQHHGMRSFLFANCRKIMIRGLFLSFRSCQGIAMHLSTCDNISQSNIIRKSNSISRHCHWASQEINALASLHHKLQSALTSGGFTESEFKLPPIVADGKSGGTRPVAISSDSDRTSWS